MTTLVEPSLNPWAAILASGRHRRAARKWPWAWRCTTCPDAYGAARTHAEAQAAADTHQQTAHNTEAGAR